MLELQTLGKLSRLLASSPAPAMPEGLRQRLYAAVRESAVPGLLRLVKVLTAAAAVILLAASLGLLHMRTAPCRRQCFPRRGNRRPSPPTHQPMRWRIPEWIGAICDLQAGPPRIFPGEHAVARIKTILVIACVIIFAAGLSLGLVGGRATAASGLTAAKHGHSWLGDELDLTPQQQEQMHKIWSDVTRDGPGGGHACSSINSVTRQIRALLTPEQISRYDQIQKDHQARVEAAHAEMRKRVEEAERRTREILTDSQRIKFDQISKRHHEHDHEGGRSHGYLPPPPPAPPPATQPGV